MLANCFLAVYLQSVNTFGKTNTQEMAIYFILQSFMVCDLSVAFSSTLVILPSINELRIGFHTTLTDIDALILLLLANAYTHGHFNQQPDPAADDKHPRENGKRANELTGQSNVGIGDRH